MPASRIAALGLTLLLAAGLAACGGDDGGDEGGGDEGGASGETVSAEAYATDVCAAMQEWTSGVQSKIQGLSGDLTSNDPEEGKRVLADLLGEMSEGVGELASAVEAAGVPDVEGGEEASESIVSAFRDVQTVLEDTQQDFENLPSDPQAFQQGVADLGSTLQSALAGVGGSIEEPDSPELQEAFEKEESCASIS